jgi:hypothetical protein
MGWWGQRTSTVLLAGGLGLLVAPRSAPAADPACALAVNVEGDSLTRSLAPRLLTVARRVGACEAPSWALRVAPGPNGSFVIALWNGQSLETRFATNDAEVEPVASTLLRVALAANGQVAAEDTPAGTPTSTPSASAAPASSEQPPSPPAAPPVSPPAGPFFLGLRAGPAASRGGFGAEGGVVLGLWWRHLGLGVVGRFSSQGQALHSRRALETGVIGLFGSPFGATERVWLGAVAELGVSSQQAKGEADGSQATLNAGGLGLGAGALVSFAVTEHVRFGGSILARWSSASASPRTRTTTTEKGNNGNGVGSGKTVTVTTDDPASREASDALGGVAGSLGLFVGYAF